MTESEFKNLKMSKYFLKTIELGNFKIRKVNCSEDDLTKFKAKLNWIKDQDSIEMGSFTSLILMDYYTEIECIMSDFYSEKETNLEFIQKASGDVLIGGLGLGMVVLAIQDKPDVNKIVILEKHKDIIKMVQPRVPFNKKVLIVNQDVFKGLDLKNKFNAIYFDIWNTINGLNLIEMDQLERLYKKNLRKGGWMDCWAKKECLQTVKDQCKETGRRLEESLFIC